ncbi:MAG TPA: sodium:proton exchanger [Actinomycetota bacterium]|nr:sodium:proton exchanger [Actinomycetota bacterium]
MTTQHDDLIDVHPARQLVGMGIAIALTLPGIVLRFTHPDLPHPLEALLFGISIVGSAFLLSWAAEAAQLDISAGLATAVLALIAVLPEYAVDFVFAWEGGESYQSTNYTSCPPLGGGEESPCSLALANMTGANRLLIGIGWTMVVFIAWYRLRKRGDIRRGVRWPGVQLDREHAIELSYLTIATVYSLTLPLKHSITLIDAAILVSIFVFYTLRVARAPAEEPHLVGPARLVGSLPTAGRRSTYIAMMVFAALVILLSAEAFAEALVATGEEVGISEFLLVQWLAPLASEAPELLIAGLFAWRLNTNAGLGTLVSSKVNQWTLLVGTLPIVFAISSGSLHGLPIDAVQREELFLTAAQSFFAITVLINLRMSLREAGVLFGLFWFQFVLGAVVPESLHGVERIAVGVLYLALGAWQLLQQRTEVRPLLHDGFRASYDELGAAQLADAE